MDETTPKVISYFAIGSMMNRTGMLRRDIHPLSSRPATLLDFRVVFKGMMGMAVAEEAVGEEFEGVVHQMPEEEMAGGGAGKEVQC